MGEDILFTQGRPSSFPCYLLLPHCCTFCLQRQTPIATEDYGAFLQQQKTHWPCHLYPARADFERTSSAILQCHPCLKALGFELRLSRKIYNDSEVKVLIDSFTPLTWTELSKAKTTIICVGLVSGWKRELSRSTTELRVQSTHYLYIMYMYILKMIMCNDMHKFCSAVELQNPTHNFHLC